MKSLGGLLDRVVESRRRRWQAKTWPGVKATTYVDRTARVARRADVRLGEKGHIARFCDVDVRSCGSVRVGDRVFLDQRTRLASTGGRLSIGADCFIGSDAIIAAGTAGLVIGRDCLIGPGVWIFAENHVFARTDIPVNQQGMTSKGIVIGDDVWIGARSLVLDGVSIGDHCVIAAGSVVTRSLAAGSVCAGSPAKLVRFR